MLLYSALAELLLIVCCFLDFQDNKATPNFTTYPVTDLLVLGQAAQSESQYTTSSCYVFDGKNSPSLADPFKYLTTLIVTSKLDCFGLCMN